MTIEPRPRAKACDQCYRKKQGCSKTQPKCERCLVTSSACTYSFGKFMGKPKRSTLRLEEENYLKSKATGAAQTCFRKESPEREGRVCLPTPTSSHGKSSPSPPSPPPPKIALKRPPSADSIANSNRPTSPSIQRTLKRDQPDSPETSGEAVRSPKRVCSSPDPSPSHSPESEGSSIDPSVLHAAAAPCDPMMLPMDFMGGDEFLDPLSPLPLVDQAESFGMPSLQWMGIARPVADETDFSKTPASEYSPSSGSGSGSSNTTGSCSCLSNAVGALSAIHDSVQSSDHHAPDKVVSAARRGFAACQTVLTQCQTGCSNNVVVVSLCVSILDQVRRAYDLVVSHRIPAALTVRLGHLEWALFDSHSVLTTILDMEKKDGAAICAMLQAVLTRLGMPVDQHWSGVLEAFRGS